MPLCVRKNRVGFWRKIRGFTQDQVGRKIHVTGRTISSWELDITCPTKEQADALARVLGVSVRELFPYELF
ncbi:MAG: helix-turn-helix transcriptional regulator [Mycobacterium leprae]